MAHGTVTDDDDKLVIDTETRKINIPKHLRTIGVVGDHNSEQLTFRCSKLVDGHDVSACARKWISFTNAAGEVGKYTIDNATVDGDNVDFTWLIDSRVTAAYGKVSFSIHLEDIGDNGVIDYRWSTVTNTDLKVDDTVFNEDEGDPTEEDFIYADIDMDKLSAAVSASVGGVLNG